MGISRIPTDEYLWGAGNCLELVPKHAEVARANIFRAGFSKSVEIRVGDAMRSLETLIAEGTEPFDLIFIDADKRRNPEYLKCALHLSRKGTLIIGDNALMEPG